MMSAGLIAEIEGLSRLGEFPYAKLTSTASRLNCRISEAESLIASLRLQYELTYTKFQLLILLYCFCLLKKWTQFCEAALEFFQAFVLVKHALIELKGSADNRSLSSAGVSITKFKSTSREGLIKLFSYVQGLIEHLVPALFELGLSCHILESIRIFNLNSSWDPMPVLFEAILIMKVDSCLSERSKFEFHHNLKEMLTRQKTNFFALLLNDHSLLSTVSQSLRRRLGQNHLCFQKLAILRTQEYTYDHYDLCFPVRQKGHFPCLELERVPALSPLRDWVRSSFEGHPSLVDLSSYLSRRIGELHTFMVELEVYGSSPFINSLDGILTEDFVDLFTAFLQGHKLTSKQYSPRQEPWMRQVRELKRLWASTNDLTRELVLCELQGLIKSARQRDNSNRGQIFLSGRSARDTR